MTHDDFIKLVFDMRYTQKLYFQTRNKTTLVESKRLEKKVDDELRRLLELEAQAG